jgi:hypothetical protein
MIETTHDSRRFRRLLLCVGLIVAFATTGFVAVPAFATDESYECGSCTAVNGHENYVKNNFSINFSGEGACAVIWRNNGGGSYTQMGAECAGGSSTAHVCLGGEVYGHGETESLNFASWLYGVQDNYKKCE